MIGKQMMGKISSRCRQARGAADNPTDEDLGNMSAVLIGDPAQCPPIRDEPCFETEPHKDTRADPDAIRVRMSNRGAVVYDSFRDVIILQRCHRVRTRQQTTDAADVAYNERGARFVQIMTRLRDCEWTEADYYWLCRRKLGDRRAHV